MAQHSSLVKALVASASIVIVLAGIKAASEIVVPFLLALFIAIICSPLLAYLTKRKVPYWLAITTLLLLIFVIFFFLFGLINSTVQEFSQSIPQYRQLLAERVNDVLTLAQKWKIPLDISENSIMENFDPSAIMKFVQRVFLNGIMSYLAVKTMMSVLTAICVWALLEVAGVQYAILWATLSFLLNYIPNIGSIIAAVPIVVQALLLNGFIIGLGVLVGVVIINVVIGSVLEPRLMGKKLGLSTLVVFLSLLFWGWLLGTVGMLLSVPLTMALKIALEAGSSTAKYAILLGDGHSQQAKR